MEEQSELEKRQPAASDLHRPVAHSRLDAAPKRGHRIVGIDMARSLAIFLMVVENYKNAMEAHGAGPAWLVWFFSHIEGRAAPAFVTIMGAGLALLARKALESNDSALRRDSALRIHRRLAERVLAREERGTAQARVAAWLESAGEELAHWQRTFADMRTAGDADFATLSVGVETVRKLAD